MLVNWETYLIFIMTATLERRENTSFWARFCRWVV